MKKLKTFESFLEDRGRNHEEILKNQEEIVNTFPVNLVEEPEAIDREEAERNIIDEFPIDLIEQPIENTEDSNREDVERDIIDTFPIDLPEEDVVSDIDADGTISVNDFTTY